MAFISAMDSYFNLFVMDRKMEPEKAGIRAMSSLFSFVCAELTSGDAAKQATIREAMLRMFRLMDLPFEIKGETTPTSLGSRLRKSDGYVEATMSLEEAKKTTEKSVQE